MKTVTLTPGAATYNLTLQPAADLRHLAYLDVVLWEPLGVRRALLPVTVVTLIVVAVQLSIFSSPALRRRRGHDRVALAPRHGSRRADDARAVVRDRGRGVLRHPRHDPLRSDGARGSRLAYGASRSGPRGRGRPRLGGLVGDAAAGRGGAASSRRCSSSVASFFTFNFSLWRDSLVAAMVVNAVAFFVLARPMTRLARWVGHARGSRR